MSIKYILYLLKDKKVIKTIIIDCLKIDLQLSETDWEYVEIICNQRNADTLLFKEATLENLLELYLIEFKRMNHV